MKKAYLFGDYKAYEYHPLAGVDDEIKTILEENFEVTATESHDVFELVSLMQADLVILYGDQWKKPCDARYMGNLISYVSTGGKLLVIHNGISFQGNFEFLQMVGGKFDFHPPIQKLTVNPIGDHAIVDGVADFEIFDEPYRFEFASHTPRSLFLEYEMDGQKYPAGWSVDYCVGKLAFLMPGHTVETFRNENFRRLIRNAANWLTK